MLPHITATVVQRAAMLTTDRLSDVMRHTAIDWDTKVDDDDTFER